MAFAVAIAIAIMQALLVGTAVTTVI